MGTTMTEPLCYCLHETNFDLIALVWSAMPERPLIERVILSRAGISVMEVLRSEYPQVVSGSCDEVMETSRQMAAFLAGEDIHFPLDIVRMERCSPFQENILRIEHAIPRGRVSTYQRLAAQCGEANAARAAGHALATNPFPVIIPCHRTIRADGSPGGYQGGTSMKIALLALEGIHLDASGRVNAALFHY